MSKHRHLLDMIDGMNMPTNLRAVIANVLRSGEADQATLNRIADMLDDNGDTDMVFDEPRRRQRGRPQRGAEWFARLLVVRKIIDEMNEEPTVANVVKAAKAKGIGKGAAEEACKELLAAHKRGLKNI